MNLMYQVLNMTIQIFSLNTSAPSQFDENQDETCSGDYYKDMT